MLSRIALFAALAGLACGCSGRGGGGDVFRGAPIVLISVDTLRSDRLPAYGYKKVETPALDALRHDSILFSHAYSHVPLTLPSHVSILTGLLPGESGVRDNLGYRLQTDRVPYLPKLLHGLGYKTGGFASAYVLRAETGLGDGFDAYDAAIEVRSDEPLGGSQRSGKETLARALEWLGKIGREPYFLFFHIYEPHTPYRPPEPFLSRYTDKYDGEVAASDAIVGELLDALRRRGDYDRAVIVFLSDHGEGLGDHGEMEHGIFLYREALQVPLLLKLPGSAKAATTVEAPAQLTDVMPTLIRLAGGTIPDRVRGRKLTEPDATGSRQIFSETLYPRLHFGWSELTSVVDGRWHLIHGPDPELFDLQADAAETRNMRNDERLTMTELSHSAERLSTALAAPQQEDEETRARLQSLGYVGSAAPAPGVALPDPKARLGDLRLHAEAFQHFFRRDYRRSVTLFRDLVRSNPRMLDAWEHLGMSLERLGLDAEARSALNQAMEISGGSPQVALALSRVLLKLHDLGGAEQHARLGMASSPTLAHSVLAQVALERKDLPTAESEARQALAAGGSRVGGLMTLAQVQSKQQRFSEALATCDAAIASLREAPGNEGFQGLQMVRGDILARMQRNTDAIASFREEIRLFPWNTAAYTRLAVVYHIEQREGDAVGTLTAMCRENDSPSCFAEAVKALHVIGQDEAADAMRKQAHDRFPEAKELAGSS